MPSLLNLESVTLAHGARRILDGVSLGIEDGDRVGVVGRNGDGKSTLLRILSGRQEPDSGRVTHAGSLRLQMLDQHDALDPEQTVRHAVVGDVQDHVWASQARTRDVIAGLFGDLEATDLGGLDAPVATLSGGQRRRVALAGLLAVPQDRPEDVLVLDEPTNHLDVEGVDWLARHLRTRWPSGRGALVVVTHDRWFLDEVCTRTWEVHGGSVEGYDGGYAAYVLARAERNRQASATEDRRQNLLRKELAWLRRGAPARTSKPKFRIEAASDLIADVPAPRDPVELTRLATSRLGKDVLDLEDVTLAVGGTGGIGEDGGTATAGTEVRQRKVLLDDVTWRLGPGDRVGVVGVNGSGKTTLLRLLTGELRPDTGRVRRGSTVRVAMLTQEVRELEEVDDLRVVEAVERERRVVRIGDREVSASQLVERLGFARERQWTRVSELSGGERRRLQLLRLLIGEPNVLLLDEPTNDLDVDTLAEVEDLLDGWPGTLIVVSHDRYLLERVCDRQVALLGDGAVRDLPGGVEQYLQLRRTAATADRTAVGRTAGSAPPAPRESEPSAGELRDARKELARIERRLSRIATEEDGVHEEMAERATDHEAVGRLTARLRELHAEREQLEGTWLELADITG